MNTKDMYPMLGGGPALKLSDFTALYHRVMVRVRGAEGSASGIDVSDNLKDSELGFDEHPPCECCGSAENHPVLTAMDGNRVVQCSSCGLWFTSPRVSENRWIHWLHQDNSRNKEFTENRLRFGVALDRNIKYSFSFWWEIMKRQRQKQIKYLVKLHGGKVARLFDVGCGCGYFLKAAKDMGFEVGGNDLNRYAVNRIKELFKFDVHYGLLAELLESGLIPKNSYDIVYMNDYIEHSYHPKRDLTTAFGMLKENGIVYVTTFCIDSDRFEKLREKWDMLMWNHCYHFSSDTLKRLMEDAGFEIVDCHIDTARGMVEICGRKKNAQA